MTALNKQALRNLALRATPGPWTMEHENIWYYENGHTKHLAYFYQGDDVDDSQDDVNTRYVAAADPSTFLALLDELEVISKSEWKLAGDLTEAQMNNTVLEKKLEAAEERYEDMLRQARSFREAHDSAAEIIRKLERNKPTVTLPTTRLWAGKVACYEECEIREILRAAGIGVKGE